MKETAVALLGFGVVGRSFAHYVSNHVPEIGVQAVCDSSGAVFFDKDGDVRALLEHKERGGRVRDFEFGHRVADAHVFIEWLPSRGISLLVESLPTNLTDGRPALDLLEAALRQGTDIVTVDKGPPAFGFEQLTAAARESGARFCFSGTMGVQPPEEIHGQRVVEIRGVLNGTTNYILNEMQERSVSFDEAVRAAQAAGIAEPDPSLDTGGWDTAVKTLIMAKVLMGAETRLDEVSRIGIGPEVDELITVARGSGRIVRLVSRARVWQGRVRVSVAPKLVEAGTPFFDLPGTSKAAWFRASSGKQLLVGGVSGKDSISRIILADIESVRA
jgi:homoserine dehydrogenase